MAAANRDPLCFDEPARFEVRRSASHVAFGAGSHFCLGARLAWLQAVTACDELIGPLDAFSIAPPGPTWSGSGSHLELAPIPVQRG